MTDKMRTWFDRSRCKGGEYCVQCRTDAAFRARVVETHDLPDTVDFECPYGVDWAVSRSPDTGQAARLEYKITWQAGVLTCRCGSTTFDVIPCERCGEGWNRHVCKGCKAERKIKS